MANKFSKNLPNSRQALQLGGGVFVVVLLTMVMWAQDAAPGNMFYDADLALEQISYKFAFGHDKKLEATNRMLSERVEELALVDLDMDRASRVMDEYMQNIKNYEAIWEDAVQNGASEAEITDIVLDIIGSHTEQNKRLLIAQRTKHRLNEDYRKIINRGIDENNALKKRFFEKSIEVIKNDTKFKNYAIGQFVELTNRYRRDLDFQLQNLSKSKDLISEEELTELQDQYNELRTKLPEIERATADSKPYPEIYQMCKDFEKARDDFDTKLKEKTDKAKSDVDKSKLVNDENFPTE